MFEFLLDVDNYKQRKVARFETTDLIVSTARVSDGLKPFETAVKHPNYNEGNIVIVESYNTKKQAQQGHNKWIKVMTAETLLLSLVDCLNAKVAQFAKALESSLTDEQ